MREKPSLSGRQAPAVERRDMRNALAGLRSLVERDPLGRVAFDPAWIAKEGGIPEGLTQWPRTVYALMALVAAGKVARVDGTGDWRLC